MGLFSSEKQPAYLPPDLPLGHLERTRRQSSFQDYAAGRADVRHSSNFGASTFSLATRKDYGASTFSLVRRESSRQGSVFSKMRSSVVAFESPADPDTGLTHGSQQTTFLGRKISQTIVPAYARKQSLAIAERDRDPTHLRMGETGIWEGEEEEKLDESFFASRLHLDDASDDDELDEKLALRRLNKGKARADWSADLGWQKPKSKKVLKQEAKQREKEKRRHKNKRAMRELDDDLNAFNTFAQNGIKGSARGLDTLAEQPSVTSLPSMLNNAGVAKSIKSVTGTIDAESLFLPDSTQEKSRAVPVGDGYDALDVMADHIFRIGCQKKKWFRAPRMGSKKDTVGTGVTIRAKVGLYRTFPVGYKLLDEFEEAISRLNPEVAIKVKSDMVTTIMRTYINPSPHMTELVIDENTRIQILDEIPHLARARKHQYAAFVREEQVLCVWADHVEAVIPAAEALEEALMQFIWRGEEENKKINLDMLLDEQLEKQKYAEESTVIEAGDPEDVVMRKLKQHWTERPVMLWAPISDGLSIIVCILIIGLGLRKLVTEFALDGQPVRFALMVFAVPLLCIASYAALCLVGSLFQIFGPIRQVTSKSNYFSGIAPKRTMGELAHVTVQMPVYKESLEEVIMPTIESLKRAITTYERQGGSVGILICDDGLQLLDKEEADKRRQYYFNNNIAYVARPGHNVNGFIRKGRFKKAGNMNFANALSLRVEEIMDDLRPVAKESFEADHFWNDDDENQVYETALAQALEEKEGIAWAAGNIRFGPVILIVDSDTRVPEDCFADAVSEMAESPEVAIIQHMSGVMQVANHFFENGVAHFTRSIQHAISYVCASGEVAPFVGHNAFIRWSALQECMHPDPDDGVMKIWSESHVSEDFQIAITLQTKGYVIRWATYSHGEFEEGVSLTCDDELNRWQKYSFGCSELVFHPLKHWFTKGPITPLFRQFMWTAGIPLHSKFSICAYIFSYYAIGCAWLLTVANYFIVGFDLPVDGYYLPSWDVTLVCIILFIGICNVAFVTLRYRLKLPGSSKMAMDQIKWIPFFAIFFTGMSMPMSAALVSHLVGYNMTWSTTVKTVEKSNFFLQIPIIWRRFWPQLVFFGLSVVMMILTTSSLMPSGYRVTNIEVTVPMGLVTASHLLWPFALNPWFVSFSF